MEENIENCDFKNPLVPLNIADHFADIYSALYNRIENSVELEEVCSLIDSNINGECLIQLEKVNETLVKRALKTMKSCKRDSIFDSVSDCFINGPDKLIMHLTNLVKMFLVHGFVPTSVLICTTYQG